MKNIKNYKCLLLSLCLTFSFFIYATEIDANVLNNDELIDESPCPTVDPEHPNIPTVSNSCVVGSTSGAFSVNNTGAAVYSLPINCPDGILNPQIALAYNSQTDGYGLAGYGFTVTGLSAITRGKKDLFHNNEVGGVTYTDSDELFLDGKRLIRQSGSNCQEGCTYCLEGDPYTKVIAHGTYNNNTTSTWFEVQTNDGKTYQYGNASTARILYTNKKGNPRIASWYVNRVEDVHGNYITYNYTISNLYAYPQTITYGQNRYKSRGITNKVVFAYRNIGTYYGIFNIEDQKGRINKCILSITTSCNDTIYRKYQLSYNSTSDQSKCKFTRLTRIQEQNVEGKKLSPVTINWNYLPSMTANTYQIEVSTNSGNSLVEENDKSFFAADVNGDGISDIIRVSNLIITDYIANGHKEWHRETRVYISRSHVSSSGIVSFQNPLVYELSPSFTYDDFKNMMSGYTLMDLDGDGYNDLIFPYYRNANDDGNRTTFFVIKGSDVVAGNEIKASFTINLKAADQTPLFVTLDTNGDGKDEIICVEQSKKDGSYPAIIMKLKEGTELDYKEFTMNLPQKPEKMFCGDYNNDGLTDIIMLYEDGYKIYFNNGGKESEFKFTESNTKTGTDLCDHWRFQQGDFDGDGLVDFVYNVSGEYRLVIARNNGDGTFTCTPTEDIGVTDYEDSEKDDHEFALMVCDIDHDRRSDVMVCKTVYDHHDPIIGRDYYTYNSTKIKWLYSDGTTLKAAKTTTKYREDDAKESTIFVGDFNGDGYVELANYGSDFNSSNDNLEEDRINVYRTSSNMSATGKVSSIIDGMDSRTDISYASAVNPTVYTKTDMSPNQYPVNTYTLPLSVVKSMTSTNGIAGSLSTEYSYKDLRVHVKGAGLLGFSETSVTNTTTGEKTVTSIQRRDNKKYLPRTVKVTKTLGGKTAYSITDYRIYNINNTYFTYGYNTIDVDYDENTTIILTDYDEEKGCLLEHTVESDWDDMEIYKKVTYSGYEDIAGMRLPTIVTNIQKHTDDETPYTTETRYEYDNKGNILTRIDNYNTPLALTTTMTYDEFGNCLTSASTGYGVQEITTYNDYDPSGRYISKKYQVPDATVNTFTYDIWGNLLTESDETEPSNILTTRHTYDKWGQLLSSLAPDGTKTESSNGWGSSNDKKYYVLEKKSEAPWMLTWYDNVGHEVLQQSFGPQNVLISKATEYNDKGLVKKVTSINGKYSMTESFTYDDFGRLLTDVLSSGKETTYSYDNRSITTTIAGRSSTKTTDAWGNIVTSIDSEGNEVHYEYHSNGKPAKITTDGSSVTMEYDEAGNQISLSDPDAGTITYEYAADGNLLKQKDAKGVETVNTYDSRGRLTTTKIGNSYSNTIKKSYGNSEYNKHRLKTWKIGTQSYVQYTYDKYGRIITEKRYVNRKEYFYTYYEYDERNRLAKTTYPGGLEVVYQYDDYGHHVKTTANGKDVYRLTSYDGLTTKSLFLNGISVTLTKDTKGYESERKLTKKNNSQLEDSIVILDCHQVSYDPLTDNVLARKRYNQDVEVFGYDNLDRLVSVSNSSARSITGSGALTETMNITYAPNGNILSKTGLGDYTYNSNYKPHAVMSVANSAGLIATDELITSFNDLGRINAIEETAYGREMNFSYGPDLQRWYTTYSVDGQEERTTFYVDNYEKIIENGITREFYYLDGGVIIIKENDIFKPYLAFTDNLGSILSVVNENGEKVYNASYDAWGQQTVTVNVIDLHRGYTGHEMLPEFGLVNMNGRLYDPLLGRFLSPDNYVQLPDFSQNYNRYSYCLNNPLKYKDPSGELFGIDDALVFMVGAALVGGTCNLVANWDNCNGFMQCLTAFVVGAGSGALIAATGGTAGIGTTVAASALCGAGTAATNSVIAQTGENFEGLGSVDWSLVGENAVIGAAAGAASGAAGYWASNTSLSFNGVTIKSPVLRSIVATPLASGAGHIAGGTVFGLLHGNSLGESLDNSFEGIGKSILIGEAIGVTSTIATCYATRISPWTGERIQRHHSFPKALGGNVNQELTPMSTSRHQNLHREMNQYLKTITTEREGKSYDMFPRKGNSGRIIQHNFMESQRFNAVKGFYDLHQIKYFDARYDFYYNNGIIKEWRPW